MKYIRNNQELLARARKMLPKSVPAEAVESVRFDSINGGMDGYSPSYWVYLADGYTFEDIGSATIHEDTLKALKYELSTVKPE